MIMVSPSGSVVTRYAHKGAALNAVQIAEYLQTIKVGSNVK
jgi:hypothetical protein